MRKIIMNVNITINYFSDTKKRKILIYLKSYVCDLIYRIFHTCMYTYFYVA